MYDLRPLIQKIEQTIYEEMDKQFDNVYGLSNVVNLLYSIDSLPADAAVRDRLIKALQRFQNPDTGLFTNSGNYESHTTAFVSGALNLLDAKPLYKADSFKQYDSKDELFKLMDSIDWAKEPWLGAHLGAGIYASMVLTQTASPDWEDYYFEWLDANVDESTGLWKKGALEGAPRFHYLASTFHYVFNYEYAKRALPYPQALLDTCISAYRNGDCIDFSKEMGWPDIDFSYLIARVQRRAGVRFEETQTILKEIADGLIAQMLAMPEAKFHELHTMFALVCALAVLQDALPGYIRTTKPLRLVLDRRPFL